MGSLLASQGAWVHMPPPHWPLGSRGGALCTHWCARILLLDLAMRIDWGSVFDSARSRDFTNWHRPKSFLVKIFLYIKSYWGRPFSGSVSAPWYSLQIKTFHLGVLSGHTTKPETNHPTFQLRKVSNQRLLLFTAAVARGGDTVAQKGHGGAEPQGDGGLRGNWGNTVF